MAEPTILVTGATGKTGGAVAVQLLKMGLPVRALVRSRDARSESLERMGAEIAVADVYDPDQLIAAMRGTERAYYCPPIQPYMIQSASAFAIAAKETRLQSIVLLSQWLSSPAHPALMTRQTWLADQIFQMLPETALTIVNPGFFADNYLRLMPYAAHLGIFPSLFGETRNAPNEDIARVVVAALANPERHAGKRYRPTGPALLSSADMAAILGRILGRTVRRVAMPHWLLLKAGRSQGSSAYEMSVFLQYIIDHKQGAFAYGAPTNDILDVTGAPAETFETTARRYAARPDAQRSFANTMRAFAGFMLLPMMPGYDIARLDRDLRAPVPAAPRFAMEDPRWQDDHRASGADIAAAVRLPPQSRAPASRVLASDA